MSLSFPMPEPSVADLIREGIVIPAHPLALNSERKLDERRQRALTRYYLESGARGLAVGVHTTQFAIRDPQINLLQPVLKLARDVAVDHATSSPEQDIALVAGVCGTTTQAVAEARLAKETGYHLGLLSLAALPDAGEEELIEHAQRVAREIPIFGFYLQPAVGGLLLPFSFWRKFVEIPNVVAIKIAAFNRYQTLDVVRAVAESGRQAEISLYTGNDDSIVADLLTAYQFSGSDGAPGRESTDEVIFAGGLLGHWACWTSVAVQLLERCKLARNTGSGEEMRDLLTIAQQVTDMNAAIFDAQHEYAGCIAGIHEVLRRQGLMEGVWCLDKEEQLSPGQSDEISRVCSSYPHLTDDEFVASNVGRWLA